jgi:hypothetical protein
MRLTGIRNGFALLAGANRDGCIRLPCAPLEHRVSEACRQLCCLVDGPLGVEFTGLARAADDMDRAT